MKKLMGIIMALTLTFSASQAFSASELSFPQEWRTWTRVTTPLTQIGALPGCEADVSALPSIYQQAVATYCAVKPGGPGKVSILVKGAAAAAYGARSGKFADGANMILHLEDLSVLFVSGHREGKALYGIFTEDGKDVASQTGSLSPEECRNCHTGYSAFCVNGQCGKLVR